MERLKIVESIESLLSLDADNALVPHGIGGHARQLFEEVLPFLRTVYRTGKGESLDLAELRAVSLERQASWCPEQVPDLSFRGNELAGEVGEACNVIKKLERERHGWRGSRATLEDLADELADVVICADLAAMSADVDLGAAVRRKFNATSDKVGLPHKLNGRALLSREDATS